MQRYASVVRAIVLVGSLVGLAGCGSDEPKAPEGCPPGDEVRGVCAGVPRVAICEDDACAADVACTGIVRATGDAELQAAAAGATPGGCIALAPGAYGAVELPGGVSLLGRSADDVTVQEVALGAGEGAVVRGVTASSLHVRGATGAKIVAVHVRGSADSGVVVDAQSSVAVVASTIEGAALYGIFAVDPRAVSLDRVVIAGSGGPGLWVASSSDCAAPPAQPALDVTSSVVRDSHIAGVALFGAKAVFRGLDILATVPGDGFETGRYGGGLSVASCSDLDAKGLRVNDSKSYGVLVDASRAVIGGTGVGDDVEISRNLIGLSVQSVPESFVLENAQLDENEGFGIGISGASRGVIICRSSVSRTASKTLPVIGAGRADVGHGVAWTEGSNATLMDVRVSESATASVLIDGEATGTLYNVALSGGDEALGIVQQNLMSGGAQPTVEAGTPALQPFETARFPAPARPDLLPKQLAR